MQTRKHYYYKRIKMNLVRKLPKQLSFFYLFHFLKSWLLSLKSAPGWCDGRINFKKILQILIELSHKIKYILCWHSWSRMIVLQVSTVPLQVKKFLKKHFLHICKWLQCIQKYFLFVCSWVFVIFYNYTNWPQSM